MTTPDPTSSEPLQEALSVDTSPERLEELFQVDPTLGPLIASNPSTSLQLLDQLAVHFPVEVLANRSVIYSYLSLRSLVCLCLVCDMRRDACLSNEILRRIHAGIDELQTQEYATLECDWLYNRIFTLLPTDCEALIDEPIEFRFDVFANMQSEGPILVSGLPDFRDDDSGFPGTQKESLADFLQIIGSCKLRAYINDQELVREDGGFPDIDLQAVALPKGLSLDGTTLSRSAEKEDEGGDDGEPILEFFHSYGGCNSSIVYEDGVVTVPVEFVDEVNHHYSLAMGELGDLAGIESKCPSLPADWHQRLAALLIP
jgi:hypothetical protein